MPSYEPDPQNRLQSPSNGRLEPSQSALQENTQGYQQSRQQSGAFNVGLEHTEAVRKRALAKLTPEERDALGLR